MSQFIEGFVLQMGLILGLGAQNIFVLESGLKKQRHLLVATVCAVCDNILIAIGVLGAAAIFIKHPILKISFGVIGILFLVYYGLKKFTEGFRKNQAIDFNSGSTKRSVKQVILLSLGFTLLNPHVYLDTVILIGGYAAKYSDLNSRLQFGAGAGALSILWFFGLSLFSYAMSSFLNNPKAMRWVAIVSGIVLLSIAWKLSFDVYAWIRQTYL